MLHVQNPRIETLPGAPSFTLSDLKHRIFGTSLEPRAHVQYHPYWSYCAILSAPQIHGSIIPILITFLLTTDPHDPLFPAILYVTILTLGHLTIYHSEHDDPSACAPPRGLVHSYLLICSFHASYYLTMDNRSLVAYLLILAGLYVLKQRSVRFANVSNFLFSNPPCVQTLCYPSNSLSSLTLA